jgi:hypothetical protein
MCKSNEEWQKKKEEALKLKESGAVQESTPSTEIKPELKQDVKVVKEKKVKKK